MIRLINILLGTLLSVLCAISILVLVLITNSIIVACTEGRVGL